MSMYVKYLISKLFTFIYGYFKLNVISIRPSTFEYILSQIQERLHGPGNGIEMISPEKQFLIALWRFATPDSYR